MARAAVVAMRCSDEHGPATAASVRTLLEAGWGVALVAPAAAADAAALAIGPTRAGRRAVPVAMHILVDPADPAFAHPGGAVDPEPLAVLEAEGIGSLIRAGFPVVVTDATPVVPAGGAPEQYRTVTAVLDEAAAAQRLAGDLAALALVFVVDDDARLAAGLPAGGDDDRAIDMEEAERRLASDAALAAELRAAVRFLRAGGEVAVIAAPACAAAALDSPSDGAVPALRIHRELTRRAPSDVPVLTTGWSFAELS
jgi:carbamate kinase